MTKINTIATSSTINAINMSGTLKQVQQEVNSLTFAGSQGNVGLQGSPGIGLQGNVGLQGNLGIQGNVGLQGNLGIGFQGSVGLQGSSNSGSSSLPGGNNNSIQFNNNNSFGGITLGSTGSVLCSLGSSTVPSFNTLSSSGGFGSPQILGATFVCINTILTAPATFYNVYTVPNGFRAVMLSWNGYNNGSTALSSTNFMGIYARISGISYLTNLINFMSANSNSSAAGNNLSMRQYIFDQNETIQLAVAVSVTEIILRSSLIIFPISLNPYLYTIKKFSNWINGDNIIYTVPSNSYSLVVSPYFNIYSMDAVTNTELVYINQTGSPVILSSYVVPPGGSVSNIYRTSFNNTNVNNNSSGLCGVPKILNAGDQVILNTNSANNTQMSYLTVYNVPIS